MVRFTPDEWSAVEERARACGRAPAVYIREAALGAVPKARRVPEHSELIRQLARLGNALTALAVVARAAGDDGTARGAEPVLAEVLDAVRRWVMPTDAIRRGARSEQSEPERMVVARVVLT